MNAAHERAVRDICARLAQAETRLAYDAPIEALVRGSLRVGVDVETWAEFLSDLDGRSSIARSAAAQAVRDPMWCKRVAQEHDLDAFVAR